MKKDKKYIIWSNINIDQKDWIDEEGNEMEYEEIYELLNLYIVDERINLSTINTNKILVIADLGLWNRKAQGYKIIDNINEILYDENCDFCEWYCDDKDLKFIGHHHDGTNCYLYREIKSGINIDPLLDEIYLGKEISKQKLSYYTKSLVEDIKEIYGW